MQADKNESSFKRKLSKREKKEQKKKQEKGGDDNKENDVSHYWDGCEESSDAVYN